MAVELQQATYFSSTENQEELFFQFYTNDLENITEVAAGKKKEIGKRKKEVVNTIQYKEMCWDYQRSEAEAGKKNKFSFRRM